MRCTTTLALTSLFILAGCGSSQFAQSNQGSGTSVSQKTASSGVDASDGVQAMMLPTSEFHRAPSVVDPFETRSPLANQGSPMMPVSSKHVPYSVYGNAPRTSLAGLENVGAGAGENMRRISFADQGADFDPCTSPDGKWVFFASTRHRPTADIYVKSVDGTAVTQLTSDPAQDVMPAVSPDGKRIAFCSNRSGSWDIFVMNAGGIATGSGGQAVQVTSDPGQELHPTWSPDGRWLAFCRQSEPSDRWEIWVTDATRPGVMKFLTFGLFPSWQPSGNKIAFQRSRERGDKLFSIWTVDVVDGEAVNPTEVISSATAAAINPTWSPDGQTIAFSVIPNPAEQVDMDRPAQADVWIVKADGSGRANLTGGHSVNLSPVWSSDNRVYFVSSRGGTDNIWSIGAGSALLAMNGPSEAAQAVAGTSHSNNETPAAAAEQPAQQQRQPAHETQTAKAPTAAPIPTAEPAPTGQAQPEEPQPVATAPEKPESSQE